MTSNYHTPISYGAEANSSTINSSLAQLDQAITNMALVEADGHIIQEEGVDLAQQQRLNFTGDGVTASNNGASARTDIEIQATPENVLINGGFIFASRQTPGTFTTIVSYSADRWRCFAENADLQYRREDGGPNSLHYGSYKKITNAGKFFVCQIVEGVNSVPLRGKKVVFQIKMKASSAKTIRMGVIELQTGGTIDTMPVSVITAWNSDGVDPSLGTNLAIVTAAQSKSVTTSWQTFSVSVTVPATSKNLVCAIWSNADFSASDILDVAEAGLYPGENVVPWTERAIAFEGMLCARYYEKGAFALVTTASGVAQIVMYKVPKRIAVTPSVTPASGTGATFTNYDEGGFLQITNHSAWVNATYAADAEL